MQYKTIRSLRANEIVYQTWLVSKIEHKLTKKEKPYTRLLVIDSTGTLEINLWAVPDTPPELQPGAFVILKTVLEDFKGRLSASSKEAPTVCEAPKDIEIYQNIKGLKPDEVEKAMAVLINAISLVKSPYILKHINKIFKNPDLLDKYKNAPASVSNRSAYRFGLIEHVAKVMQNALSIVENLNNNNSHKYDINLDIVIAGVLFHDLGKSISYRINEQGVAENTRAGNLLQHLPISYAMSHQFFSEEKERQSEIEDAINHAVLAHHGTLEHGSPVKPMTVEAAIVHYADLADSSISNYIENILDGNVLPDGFIEGTHFSSKKLFKS